MDLYQAFSQRTGPGRSWISLSARFLARFGYPQGSRSIPDILYTPTTLKHVTFNPNSVTDVLNQKCYRCLDCAPAPVNGERRTRAVPSPAESLMPVARRF